MDGGIAINRNMISWAITRAGFEFNEFAARFPHVTEWIAETKKPTLKQLEKFSHSVHLPFGYLFLQTPPKENIPFPFFRTGQSTTNEVSLNLYDTISLIQRRQDWMAEYLRDNHFDELPFVGKFHYSEDFKGIVTDMRQTLKLPEDWASKIATWEHALDYLTAAIEEAGVFIVFNGIVENNTHRALSVEECRGFVLVDPIAPFMFINAADGKAAQMFTIVHELAHIWVGKSAGFDIGQLLPADDPIELLCNQVAAEFLVPEISFLSQWGKNPDIATLARFFKVSRLVIARRALDLGKISKKDFFTLYNAFVMATQAKKDAQGGGGNFYATQKRRLGLRYVSHINHALGNNQLLYRDAYKLTGLKGDTYQKFIKEYLSN